MLSRRQSFTSATAYSATAARRFGGGRGRRTRPRAPLTTEIYAADPSAHFFGDRIFVYCSHDSPVTHLRDAKVAPLRHHANGSIEPIFHHGVGWRSMYRHAGQQLSGSYRA